MKLSFFKLISVGLFILITKPVISQESQTQTQLKVKQLIEKKAEYHRLTGGEQDGYRIKIHFGTDKDKAKSVVTKFQQRFADILTYEEYQLPNWVVLVGDFKSKLEAFETLKKIQGEFPTSFIVKGKIKLN
jgi:hypothetical protein